MWFVLIVMIRVPHGAYASRLHPVKSTCGTERCPQNRARCSSLIGLSSWKALPSYYCFPQSQSASKGDDGQTCDLDRANVSVVSVGGKDKFRVFTELLDQLEVDWRIVADRDAVSGDTLATFKMTAEVSATATVEEQATALLKVGVAVLCHGEIEDYYPISALASLGGCSDTEAEEAVAERRLEFEAPTARQLVEAVIRDHHEHICQSETNRLHKLVPRWYDQSLQALRDGGTVGQLDRKTGDVLTRWLKMSKPEIAQRIAAWMAEDPDRIPNTLTRLVRWVVKNEQ